MIGAARKLTVAVATALCLLAVPAGATAERIYWTDFGSPERIGFAAVDGSVSGTLNTGGAEVTVSRGLVIDSAADRVLWGGGGMIGGPISFASLAGTGGGPLIEDGSVLGLAIDPAAGRLYWALNGKETIRTAPLAGGPVADLNIAGASAIQPISLAIDTDGGRVFWTDYDGDAISFARLDGSGGGTLPIAAGLVKSPSGIAIDPVAGRVYWSNYTESKIFSSDLAGGAAAELSVGLAPIAEPMGLAIDPVSQRIYWASGGGGGRISSAALDGTGGSELSVGVGVPGALALQAPPRTAWPAGLGGPARVGVPLSCESGSWDTDLPGANYYRAPSSLQRAWTKDGIPIPGANGASMTPRSAGVYGCAITAANAAGSSTIASEPVAIVTLGKPKQQPRKGAVRLPVRVPARGKLQLSGKGVVARSYNVAKAKTQHLVVRAKGAKRRALDRRGKVKVRVRVRFSPAVGRGGLLERPVVLRLNRGL